MRFLLKSWVCFGGIVLPGFVGGTFDWGEVGGSINPWDTGSFFLALYKILRISPHTGINFDRLNFFLAILLFLQE